MRLPMILPLVFIGFLFCAEALHAQGKSPVELHNDGVAALRKSDYPNAQKAFAETLRVAPENASALYNLGLTEYRLGNEGQALGLWRKALAVAPGFAQANHAIDWAKQRLPRSAAPTEFSSWEQFREMFLVTIPISSYLFLIVGLLLACGWLVLRYLGNRRRAILDERPMPPFPWVAAVFATLWICMLGLAGAKFYDSSVLRATVVQEKVPVRTAPDAESTALFDLFEGYEVIVRNSQQGWFQVTQPGGLTGWVPVNTVLVTSAQAAK